MSGKMKESGFCNVGESFSAMPPEPCPAGDPPAPIPPIALALRPPGGIRRTRHAKIPGIPPGPQWGRNAVLLLGCVGRVAGRPNGQAQADFPQSNRLEWPRRRAWPTPNGRFPTLCGARVAHRLEWPRKRGKEPPWPFRLPPRGRRAGYSPPFPLSDEGPCHLLPAKALILSALAALNSSLRALSLPLLYDTSFAGHSK